MINSSSTTRSRTEPAPDSTTAPGADARHPAAPPANARPPAPVLRQQPEREGGMYDSSDTEEEENVPVARGIRRDWNATAAQTPAPLPAAPESSAPEVKRARTAGPASAPVPLPMPPLMQAATGLAGSILSRQHHPELIALLQRHGGQVISVAGDEVTIGIPRALISVDLTVKFFLQKLALQRAGRPSPRQLGPHSLQAEFLECLSDACRANRPDHVRQLLATGMANQSGAQLRQLGARAGQMGMLDVVNALSDVPAYWVDGIDLRTVSRSACPAVVIGDSVQPPVGWQAHVRKDLSARQSRAALDCCWRGDSEAAVNLLFDPARRPASGKFVLRKFDHWDPPFAESLNKAGAVVMRFSNDESLVALYSSDFDTKTFADKLRQQAQSAASNPAPADYTPEMRAAAWGDTGLFNELWTKLPLKLREAQARKMVVVAASVDSLDIIERLLPYLSSPNGRPAIPWSALAAAAAAGLTSTCATLLDQGATIDTPASVNQDLLTLAAGSGHIPTCAFLLSRGVPVGSQNDRAHLAAAAAGQTKICQMLMAVGARFDVLDQNDASVLSLAASTGDINFYKLLKSYSAAATIPPHHAPALSYAASNNRVDMVKYLLDSGEPIDRGTASILPPLLAACMSGALNAARLLLASGANPTPGPLDKPNALTMAVRSKRLPVVELIAPAIRQDRLAVLLDGLNSAIKTSQPAMVRYLSAITFPHPVAVGKSMHQSPLLLVQYSDEIPNGGNAAARHEILSILLASESLPRHHVDAAGNDALCLATRHGDTVAVEMLVNAGMRVGQINQQGQHALQIAFAHLDARSGQANRRILEALFKSLSQNPGRRPSIFFDLMEKTLNGIQRDLLVFFSTASKDGPTAPSWVHQAEQSAMTDRIKPLLLKAAANEAAMFNAALLDGLKQAHVPSALLDELMRLFRGFPAMRNQLLGTTGKPEPVLQSAIHGLYLTLDTHRAALAERVSAYYAGQQQIDEPWQTALAEIANQWLSQRIEAAARYEKEMISPVFSNLLTLCAKSTMADRKLTAALADPAPVIGKARAALLQAGVYFSIAQAIDLCWTQTWLHMGARAASFAGSSSAAAERALAEEFLPAFRQTLKTHINTQPIEITAQNPDNASAQAARQFAQLIQRQLHLLKQFINAETTQTS